jgi:hypothetical protein
VSHLKRRHALPAALGRDGFSILGLIFFRIPLSDGHGGGAVVAGDRGVGPARQQRPHDPPTAPAAGPPQRRPAAITAAVDGGLGTGMAEQQAHDLEVATAGCGDQGSQALLPGDGGVGPPLEQQPHHGGAATTGR